MARQLIDNVNKIPRKPSEEIFDLLHIVMHLVRSRQYQVLKNCPYKLTHMEGKILTFFARNPGATLSELASDNGRDKAQLTRIIKTLREHKLLSASENESDKRSVRLHLTAEGNKVRLILQEELREATDLAVSRLKVAERAELLRLLRAMQAGLEIA